MTDTIFAAATPPGRSAVAVVRLSGQATYGILQRLAGKVGKPRFATLRTLRDVEGKPIDRAITLWFPGPASYTGEDSAEIHVHGGAAIMDGVAETLLLLGARLALPGEFTRRAFENGKLNLDQAEAVGDLIDAETRGQAQQAIRQLEGALGRRYEEWRSLLIGILSMLEASVDFPDEEVPADTALASHEALGRLIAEIDVGLVDEARGRRVRDGYRVAIVGAPNAGKSSLLNILVERPAAIVMPTPGTTRDIIEVPLILSGFKVILADTAGIRLTDDPVEAEGVRRARAWALGADLRIWVVDGSTDRDAWREGSSCVREGDICIVNKSDLPRSADGFHALDFAERTGLYTAHACLATGQCEVVSDILEKRVIADLGGQDFPVATRLRHAGHLRAARDHLARAAGMLSQPELASEDVRLAARELSCITGRFGVEDVLDRVFASFCIGK